jgi:hypothetical protein
MIEERRRNFMRAAGGSTLGKESLRMDGHAAEHDDPCDWKLLGYSSGLASS